MNRKKKLLNSINANTMPVNNSPNKRSYSPTSESIVFSLTCMGEQNRNDSHFEQPKVIYDGKRCQVIGKKPCARDGHAGLIH